MKFFLLSMFLVVSISGFAQKKPANPKPYAATITAEDLKKHLYIVASAEMEGRETATEGQRKAAAYIEAQFKNLGLLPGYQGSYQQPYPVFRDSLVISRMSVNGASLKSNEDFQASTQFGTEVELYFSEVVYAGYGVSDSTYTSYGNTNVAGKAVLVVEGGPSGLRGGTGRNSPIGTIAKVNNARTKGASAVFIVSSNFMPSTMGNRMYLSLYRDAQYPATYLINDKTAERIIGPGWVDMREKLKTERPEPKIFRAEVEVSLDKKLQKLSSSNVIGLIEGTDKKDEYLILTAHYDHLGKRGNEIYYGANDDGSGTVSVLEMAEAFAKAKAEGKGPRRTVIFMTVSGEEKGLWGSAYYATHPTVNTEKITANLNIDMVGRIDIDRKAPDSLNYVYVVGDDKISSESKTLVQAANSKYLHLGLDYKFNDPKDPQRIYYRSDHYNFAKVGVPIIFYTDGVTKPDYHRPTDTPDKINYTLLAKRTQLVFYTAWEMANRENQLKRDIPLPKE
ncbi:MAG: M28 family peptidase [Cyclobacteriaceae bacterium]|nr:M28 family peptidase [Cyclobacteriaceae bacterium]